ncbi:ankyrin repeat and fibronectin type-III domain-containing protein 1, partial [Trichinella spiralis]|uniref:ankyrin repeat and fibronectin type-III domain-containing protein 1 n=1 Tax=Trichinella spiralis TaxID=6334 RepID=UPI0001EFD685
SVFNQHFLSKNLLNNHKSYNDDESEISGLFTAVENDDIGKVNFYLRKCMHSAIRTNKHGLTALDVASMLNHTKISHILLRNGAQENLECAFMINLFFIHSSVEWSLDKHFTKAESKIVVDLRIPKFTITNLCPGKRYYVRVYAGNYVGFSAPSFTLPESNIPSFEDDLKKRRKISIKNMLITNSRLHKSNKQ